MQCNTGSWPIRVKHYRMCSQNKFCHGFFFKVIKLKNYFRVNNVQTIEIGTCIAYMSDSDTIKIAGIDLIQIPVIGAALISNMFKISHYGLLVLVLVNTFNSSSSTWYLKYR